MSNLCFDCKFARADLCIKIARRETPEVKTCLNFERDCEPLKRLTILEILGLNNKQYSIKKKSYGDKWVVNQLKRRGYNVFFEKDGKNTRFYKIL